MCIATWNFRYCFKKGLTWIKNGLNWISKVENLPDINLTCYTVIIVTKTKECPLHIKRNSRHRLKITLAISCANDHLNRKSNLTLSFESTSLNKNNSNEKVTQWRGNNHMPCNVLNTTFYYLVIIMIKYKMVLLCGRVLPAISQLERRQAFLCPCAFICIESACNYTSARNTGYDICYTGLFNNYVIVVVTTMVVLFSGVLMMVAFVVGLYTMVSL